MSLLKRSAAAAAALLMTFSLASCGKDTSWGAEIDGTQLRAGILIYYQSSAMSEAYSLVGSTGEETDILNETIEEKPAKEWINDKAVEHMQEYAAFEHKFDELGLSFENNEDQIVTATAEQWWEYLSDSYESIGVSKQTYIDIGINSQKEAAIFDYYYGEGGEKAVSENEIKTYLTDNNARIKYMAMDLKDAEGNVLKSEDKEDRKKMAEEYIERLKNGETFSTISAEYDSFISSLSSSGDETDSSEASEDIVISADDGISEDDAADYGTVVSKDSAIPAASVIEKVFSGDLAEGDYVLVEDYETYYIITKMDLFADPDYLENSSETAIHALKDDEFNEMVQGWLAEQNVTVNQASLDRYKLDKLTM